MPISERVPTWAAVPAVFAVLAVISYQTLITPYNLEGAKNVLPMGKTIPLPVDGPESIEWDPQGGGPYAAVVDGRILKWRGDDLGWVEFAHTSPHRGNCSGHGVVPTCGRPLGLTFEKKTGDLYICDGYLGVMKVGPEGGLAELVVDQAEGRKVMFANQMDIDEEEDDLYFNDSSDKYHFSFKPHGVAVKISGETGEILEILEDKEGETMQYVSEVYERDDGKLWLSSVFKPAVWVLDRNSAGARPEQKPI